MSRLVLATRGSALALAQAELVAAALRAAHADLEVELRTIQTRGDRVLDRALSAIGDKGLFVKELEEALLAGEADLAVHSCKDLPSLQPDGLKLAAFPRRADARDVLVSRHGLPLAQLPSGARVGTSSLRRASQLRSLRPDLEVVELRGNVDTRLRKAAGEDYDAIVLAAAGLQRLGLAAQITEIFEPRALVPMVAQGALALECRAGDRATGGLLAPLDDPATAVAVRAERALLRRLEGGCQVPIGAYATVDGAMLEMVGFLGLPDGSLVVRAELRAPVDDPERAGLALAEELLARGGTRVFEELRHQALTQGPSPVACDGRGALGEGLG